MSEEKLPGRESECLRPGGSPGRTTLEATFRLRPKTEEVDQVGREPGEGPVRAEAADESSEGTSVALKTTVAAA